MNGIFNNITKYYTNYDNILIVFLITILFIIMMHSVTNVENFDNNDNSTEFSMIDNATEIHIINLKNRQEKLKHIKIQMEKHNLKYNVFEAINGNQLDLNKLSNRNIIDEKLAKSYMNRKLRRGEYGCALSHILLWSKLLKNTSNDVKYFLILEDDAYLVNNFKKKINKILEDIKDKNWDVLYLNENCYQHFGTSCNGDDFSFTTIQPTRVGYGLYGYIINKNFVKKYMNDLFPIYYAVDVFIDDNSKSRKFTCIRSKEILVHYNKKFASDTQLIL